MGLTSERRKTLSKRKERLEQIQKNSDIMTVMEAAALIKRSPDFCYKHWKELGGTVRVMRSKRAVYVPIEKSKLMKYLDIKEKPNIEAFLSLTSDEKKQLALELLPYIRENLFK